MLELDHFSNLCARPKNPASEDGSPPRKNKLLKNEDRSPAAGRGESDAASSVGSASPMRDLLEEASRVLKSLESTSSVSGKHTEEKDKDEVMRKLQEQLNSLKISGAQQKVLRVKRMVTGGEEGLIDSGATHALRPARDGENVELYEKVNVSLADGRTFQMWMSPGGVMVSPDKQVEPIVPMGMMMEKIGCSIEWNEGKLIVHRPRRGRLPVSQRDGCPQVPRRVALSLIEELEGGGVDEGLREVNREKETKWMKDLVEVPPVLSKLPG